MAERVSARLSRAEGRRFGLVVGAAFIGLGALLWWREHTLVASVAATTGTLLVLGGLVLPDRLGPVQAAWMGLAEALSKITTPIFMGVIYFVVLTPAGLLVRLFGRNPLVRKRDGSSFWVKRDASGGVRTDMKRLF